MLRGLAFEQRAAEAFAAPPQEAVDSFLLHAPLEVSARLSLLADIGGVSREVFDAVHLIVNRVVDKYCRACSSTDRPSEPRYARVATEKLVRKLEASLVRCDIETTGQLALVLAERLSPAQLVKSVAPLIVRRAGAAFHCPILLSDIVRRPNVAGLLAPSFEMYARELARESQMCNVRGPVTRVDNRGREATALTRLLCRPATLRRPAKDLIAPTIHLVEASGLFQKPLAESLAGLTRHQVSVVLSRCAALSMLQDATEEAPYIWTHAMTVPAAIIALADQGVPDEVAVAVSSFVLLSFRAVFATRQLKPNYSLPPVSLQGIGDAGSCPPEKLASYVFHCDQQRFLGAVVDLKSMAAVHQDAHVAKYAIAIGDAARADPTQTRWYYAALAHLLSVWIIERSAI